MPLLALLGIAYRFLYEDTKLPKPVLEFNRLPYLTYLVWPLLVLRIALVDLAALGLENGLVLIVAIMTLPIAVWYYGS